MNTLLEVLLVITAFISVIPVVNLARNQEDKKYICLKFLIFVAAFWTLLIFIERTVSNMQIIYYIHMLGYPTKFLLASLMLCTIFQYIEKNISKWILGILFLIFGFELFIAITNDTNHWILDLSINNLNSFTDLYSASNGPLFLVHLILSYGVLILAVTYMFIFLAKNRGIRQYKPVTKTMIISVFAILLVNLLEFLVIQTYVDLTYISLIFASYSLYLVIYRQDMIFNLRNSGRSEILHNMREMYVLTDQIRRIIDISPTLLQRYNINQNDVIGKDFDVLVKLLENQVVLYKELNMDDKTDDTKEHYHLREKEFRVKGIEGFGYMILLYDETQVYKLLRELNQLSNFDMMTGLHNRNYIEYKLANITNTESIGIISLDLNGLKVNNDYLGHERGDYILKSLANNLKTVMSTTKEKDIARIGGDEFIIIVPNTTEKKLESIREQILKLCHSDKIEEMISVSIGVAFSTEKDIPIYQLVHMADKEMYAMKEKTSHVYKDALIEHIKKENIYIR